jgi:hypothetical protein
MSSYLCIPCPLPQNSMLRRLPQIIIYNIHIKHGPLVKRCPSVHLNMRLKLVGLHELTSADFAFIRFVLRMGKHVIFQVSIAVESFGANLALIRLVAAVNDLMSCQTARPRKRHVTLRTFKWLLSWNERMRHLCEKSQGKSTRKYFKFHTVCHMKCHSYEKALD